jgi:hypothetical protein
MHQVLDTWVAYKKTTPSSFPLDMLAQFGIIDNNFGKIKAVFHHKAAVITAKSNPEPLPKPSMNVTARREILVLYSVNPALKRTVIL